jgi:hypothetical protein
LELVGYAVPIYPKEMVCREVGVLNHLVRDCKAHDAGEVAGDNFLQSRSQAMRIISGKFRQPKAHL